MNKCLYCGNSVKNKYCDVSCQNRHQNKNRVNKKYGEIKIFKVICAKCGIEFEIKEREKLYPQKEKYYCSRSCANSRVHSNLTKDKIRQTLTKIKDKKCNCINCGKIFENRKKRKFCSRECISNFYIKNGEQRKWSILGGKKSVENQNRRSKNEVYLSELCIKEFKIVRTNKAIFNGWDADIILDDYKLAILWNGNWHHKKISRKHSLEQVQNRDKIKIREIINCGYEPYVIEDYGKYNKEFVEKEFEKLKEKIFLNEK